MENYWDKFMDEYIGNLTEDLSRYGLSFILEKFYRWLTDDIGFQAPE